MSKQVDREGQASVEATRLVLRPHSLCKSVVVGLNVHTSLAHGDRATWPFSPEMVCRACASSHGLQYIH